MHAPLDGASAAGVPHRAALKIAHEAACVVPRAAHHAIDMDVRSRASVQPNQRAGACTRAIVQNADPAQPEIAQHGTGTRRAEHAQGFAAAGVLDIEIADGVTQPCKSTLESSVFGDQRTHRHDVRDVQILSQGIAIASACAHCHEVCATAHHRVFVTIDGKRTVRARQSNRCIDVVIGVGGQGGRRLANGSHPAVIDLYTCVCTRRRDRGLDTHIAVSLQRQGGVTGPAHRRFDTNMAASRATLDGDQRHIGRVQIALQRRRTDATLGLGRSARTHHQISRIDHPLARLAGARQRGHLSVRRHIDPRSTGLDEPAVALHRRAGVKPARHLDATALVHIRQQQNPAFLLRHRARLHRAGVAHHRRRQGVRPLGRQHHLPPIGGDHAAVLDQRGRFRGVHRDLQSAVRPGREFHLSASGQHHIALISDDRAGIADLRAHQRDLAALLAADRAFVDDLTRAAALHEPIAPGQKIAVAHVQGRGDQAAHVDLRALAEQHARAINHIHLTVGVQRAHDLAGLTAHHSVQRGRLRARLLELHRRLAPNVETLPVDDRPVAALRHRHRAALLADNRLARFNLPTRWQRPRIQCMRVQSHHACAE